MPAPVNELCGVNSVWVSEISSRMATDLTAHGTIDGPVEILLPASPANEWHLGGIIWGLTKKAVNDVTVKIETSQGVVFEFPISKEKDGSDHIIFTPPMMTPLNSFLKVSIPSAGGGSQIYLNLNAWIYDKTIPHV